MFDNAHEQQQRRARAAAATCTSGSSDVHERQQRRASARGPTRRLCANPCCKVCSHRRSLGDRVSFNVSVNINT
ncbi:hypothetical protein EON67_01160 [archaeon]|nr:MAG: hypothetical protein EON67_01160 [archaeon]